MKKFIYSIICLLNIATNIALKTEKVSQYDLLYKDSFYIKIDTSTNLYKSNKKKIKIIFPCAALHIQSAPESVHFTAFYKFL